MQIEDGCIVFIDFTLFNSDGTVLDKSPDDEPLAYLHGAAGIVPALESELEGLSEGEKFDVTLVPAEAYGEYRPEAVKQLPRSQVPAGVDVQVGMRVEDSSGVGSPAVVTAVTEEFITLDANHPLAGLTLRFQGAVVEIREATEEERELAQ